MNKVIVVGVVVVGLAVLFVLMRNQSAPQATTTVPEVAAPAVVEETTTPTTIVDVAVSTPETSTLVTAVTAAELVDTLSTPGQFTVFAPVNEAFAALPAGTLDTLLLPENIADLQNVLTYHVVPGIVRAADLTDGMTLTTIQGETITVSVSDTGVSLNGSTTIVAADVMADNGVVHLIDTVLLPTGE